MMLFQNILHVFTERPDLCVRSYVREFQREEKQEAFLKEGWAALGMDAAAYEQAHGKRSPEWVIEYDRAVSRINNCRWYAMDYEAEEMSKHRKAPVLVAEYGLRTPEDDELLTLTWGADGKCICQIELEKESGALKPPKIVGVDALMDRLGGMFSRLDFWDGLLNRPFPTIAEELSRELGIFVCGPGLDAFAARNCELRREMRLGKFYRFRGENKG